MNREIETLKLENLKLKQENKMLRELLLEHNIPVAINVENVTRKLSSKEKLEIYMSYFKGRTDVYAKRFYKDGKKAYAKFTNYSENINNIYLRHLKADNNDAIGIYPLINHDKCYFLCVDFDDEYFKEASLAFKYECDSLNIPAIMELSQSGKGLHVWIFFEELVSALDARLLGDYILNKAMENNKYISFKSYDRFFPSQDFVKDDKVGNLIALPLEGYAVKNLRTTIFINNNFEPYENQINALLSTKKITKFKLDELLEEITKYNRDLESTNKLIKRLNLKYNDFARGIKIIIKNDLYIKKQDVSSKGLLFLKRISVINNPEFYEKQALRLSVYKTPRFIELFKETDDYIAIPRGLCSELIDSLKVINADFLVLDERINLGSIDVTFKGELSSIQSKAVSELLKYETGILQAPTGSGKTIMAIYLISKILKPTLIIVDSINILKQWEEKISNFLEITNNEEKIKCGVFYSNKKKLTGVIDIVSIRSLDSLDINYNYELVIADEVHHMASLEYERIIRRLNCRYFYGLTATPKRSDKLEKINYLSIGPIRFVMDKEFEMSFSKFVKPIFTKVKNKKEYDLLSYTELLAVLVNDENRNNGIVNDVINEYNNNKNILILTKRIDHVNVLAKLIEEQGVRLLTITGKNTMKEKKKFKEEVARLERQYIIISTGDYLGEGFDLPNLNTLFIVMPIKWEGLHKQYLGRVEREHSDKKDIFVYDYVDVKIPMFTKMFAHRLREYKREDYIMIGSNDKSQMIYSLADYRRQIKADISNAKKIKLFVNYAKEEVLDSFLEIECNLEITTDMKIKDKKNAVLKNKHSQINAIVIDDKIIWYGGINPFSFNKKDETILRIEDYEYANEIINDV